MRLEVLPFKTGDGSPTFVGEGKLTSCNQQFIAPNPTPP